MSTSGNQAFPRTVFDDNGHFTINEASNFFVSSQLIERFASITYARRDLDTAVEMIKACAEDAESYDDSPIEQSLWIGSVIMYCKPIKTSRARKRFDAKGFIEGVLDADGLERHEYLINLRDKMIAHDDGLGESKLLGLFLNDRPPTHVHEVGIGGGMKRVVSLGTDIAQDLTPHFENVANLFAEHESTERVRTIQLLLQSNFSDVTLLGIHKEDALDVSQSAVLARFQKHQP